MASKTVRKIGPKKYHLHGHGKLTPTVNLAAGEDVRNDRVMDPKLAWCVAYMKAAAMYTDQSVDDSTSYWHQQAVDELAKQMLTDQLTTQLTQQLGRQPSPQEFEQAAGPAWDSSKETLRAQVKTQYPAPAINLMAGQMAQTNDPQSVLQASVDRTGRLSEAYRQLPPDQQAAFTSPRLHAPALQTLPDGTEAVAPEILNSAANRAATSKQQVLDSAASESMTGGVGTGGLLDPIARAVGGRFGGTVPSAVNALAPFVGAAASDDAGGVTRRGKLTGLDIGADPVTQARAQNDDRSADLIHDYYAAVQNGDDAKASTLAQQLQQSSGIDPRALANQHVNRADLGGAVGGVGNQVANLTMANMPPMLSAALTPLFAAGEGAAVGKGDRLGTAWRSAKDSLVPTAQNVATMAGIRQLMPKVAPKVAPEVANTFRGRLSQGLNNLRNPGLVMRGGALAGGAAGVTDLYNHYMTDEGMARDKAEVRNQVLANEDRGKVRKTFDAVGAGLQAGLTGNLAPARRQFGAAYGRFDWAKDRPAGRVYHEAQRDQAAQQAGDQARRAATEALKADPRFAGVDPGLIDHLGEQAAENANNGATIDYGRDFDQQTQGKWLQQYGQARTALQAGKATPEQLQYLEELGGSPIAQGADGHPSMTPDQEQMASRNATLYHYFNRGNARQLIAGDVPYRDENGQNLVARNVIPRASGFADANEWKASWQPQAAPAPTPAPAIAQPPKPPTSPTPPMVAQPPKPPMSPTPPTPPTPPMVVQPPKPPTPTATLPAAPRLPYKA